MLSCILCERGQTHNSLNSSTNRLKRSHNSSLKQPHRCEQTRTHSDAILLCRRPLTLSLPGWVPVSRFFVTVPLQLVLGHLVLSWNSEPPSTVLALVCARIPPASHDQVSAVFSDYVPPLFAVQFLLDFICYCLSKIYNMLFLPPTVSSIQLPIPTKKTHGLASVHRSIFNECERSRQVTGNTDDAIR